MSIEAINQIRTAQAALQAALAALGASPQGDAVPVDPRSVETVLDLAPSGAVKLKRVSELKSQLAREGSPIANEIADFYFIEETLKTEGLNEDQKLNILQNTANALQMVGMVSGLNTRLLVWPQACEYKRALFGWGQPVQGAPLPNTHSLPRSNKDATGAIIFDGVKADGVLDAVQAYVERRKRELEVTYIGPGG